MPSMPSEESPSSGAGEMRPRAGLRPTRPQQAAGMRTEPPPSLPWATGRMPAATAAAAPPEEPPGVRCRSQGLCVGPKRRASLVGRMPYSGNVVVPTMMKPAARRRRVMLWWLAAARPTGERPRPSLPGAVFLRRYGPVQKTAPRQQRAQKASAMSEVKMPTATPAQAGADALLKAPPGLEGVVAFDTEIAEPDK